METSYTKWDKSEQVNILMEGQSKAQENKGSCTSECFKRKVIIYPIILGIGFLFIIALLSQSLRNEAKMSEAIEMKNAPSAGSVSQMVFNLSEEVSGIGLKIDSLHTELRNESGAPPMTKESLIPSLLEEVAKLRDKQQRIDEDVAQVLEELHNLTAAQMTKENLIPSLLEELAKLRDENKRIVEDATEVLAELHNLTEFLCTKCPPNWVSYEKSCYFFSTLSVPWTVAQQSCENQGAHLAIINNQHELKFLVIQTMADQVFWIGLSDAGNEGQWIWVDGTPLTFSFWGKGEPNNAGHGEDCATLFSNGKWNDAYCSGNEKWICERKC